MRVPTIWVVLEGWADTRFQKNDHGAAPQQPVTARRQRAAWRAFRFGSGSVCGVGSRRRVEETRRRSAAHAAFSLMATRRAQNTPL